MTNFVSLLIGLFFGLILVATPLVFAQTSDFSTGYSDGNQQGLSDKNSHVFHIGNACLNQSNSYCNGYISGYTDGFFSTLPTSSHTTITIHEESHHKGEGCHNCTKGPTLAPAPKPTPTPPPTPPKGNSTK